VAEACCAASPASPWPTRQPSPPAWT